MTHAPSVLFRVLCRVRFYYRTQDGKMDPEEYYATALFENLAALEEELLVCAVCQNVCRDVSEVKQCGHLFCRGYCLCFAAV